MFQVTPIGTCRIHNPLRGAIGKYPVDYYVPRTYGYTHTSNEALQQLDFMEGALEFPPHVVPGIFRGGSSPAQYRGSWQTPHLALVEISSTKLIHADGYSLQTRYLSQHFAEFFGIPERSRTFWALANQKPDQLPDFLEQDPLFRSMRDDDRKLLSSIRMRQQSFDELAADMGALAERIGADNLLFVTHINALDEKHRKLAGREKLIRWVERIAEDLQVPCFNPTRLMLQYGQENALENGGRDTTHYTPAFYSTVYAHLHREYFAPTLQRLFGAGAAGNDAMRAQMVADSIRATIEHVDLVDGSRQLYAALRSSPESPALIELRGTLRERLGDFEGAHADLTSPLLQSIVPGSASREALMRAAFEIGECQLALEVAEALIADEFENASILRTGALAAEKVGDRARAQAHWKQLARLDRKDVDAALKVLDGIGEEGAQAEAEWREELAYFAGQDAALAHALAAHALATQDAGLFGTATQALAAQEPIAAGDVLLRAAGTDMMIAGRKAIGLVLQHEDLPSATLRALRDIGRQWGLESVALMQDGRLSDAEVLADASADALNDHGVNKAQRALAAAMLVKARELAADENFEAVIALCEGKHGILMSRPRLALEFGRALEKAGRADDGAAIVCEAAERFPTDLPTVATAARFLRDKDVARSAALYRQAAANDPEGRHAQEIEQFFASFPRRASRELADKTASGDFDAALILADAIVETDPEIAARERGRVHRAMRVRLKELPAEADVERRLLVDRLLNDLPDDPAVLRIAALQAMDAKQFAKALGLWERLVEIDPANEAASKGVVRCRLLAGAVEPPPMKAEPAEVS